MVHWRHSHTATWLYGGQRFYWVMWHLIYLIFSGQIRTAHGFKFNSLVNNSRIALLKWQLHCGCFVNLGFSLYNLKSIYRSYLFILLQSSLVCFFKQFSVLFRRQVSFKYYCHKYFSWQHKVFSMWMQDRNQMSWRGEVKDVEQERNGEGKGWGFDLFFSPAIIVDGSNTDFRKHERQVDKRLQTCGRSAC